MAPPNVAKRMECVQLAAAFELPCVSARLACFESGSKLHALHTLRDIRRPHARSRIHSAWFGQIGLLLALVCCLSASGAEVDASKLPPPATVPVNFGRDIQPILETSCLRCHGPERPKSKFRLDNREAA